MESNTGDHQEIHAEQKFEFQIAIPDRAVQPIHWVAIAEVEVREGAEFLGFRKPRTIGGANSTNVALSVAQTLTGPKVTWYLLTPEWTLSKEVQASLEKLALGECRQYGSEPTFVFKDLPTLKQAIKLCPNRARNAPRWAATPV